MKFLKILYILLCLTHTSSLWAAATTACSKEDIQKFKEEYVKLQNALKFEGKDIALKNNRVGPVAGAKDDSESDSPGLKAEKVLFANYNNALIKVGKIYKKLNDKSATADEKKIWQSNPDVVNFFKAINTKADEAPSAVKVNMNTLLDKLQQVKIEGFTLTKEDVYLLKDLIVHSQDRICTLAQYTAQASKSNSTRTQYLEQLKNEPLNKMIESLRNMSGTGDLQLADSGTTLDQAVQDSLAKMREIIKAHKSCETALKVLNIGEKIQGCNYDRFIKSLSANDAQFDKLESVLHFINANQMANDARTSLDWIGVQFKQQTNASCYINPENKNVYVKNLPFSKDGTTIDTSKVSCSNSGKKLNGAGCVAALNVQFENGLGFKLSSNKNAKVTNVSIAGSMNCSNVALNGSPTETPTCTDKQELKDGKCVDKAPATPAGKVCTEAICKKDYKIDAPNIQILWDDASKVCYSLTSGSIKNELCKDSSAPTEETTETCTAKNQDFDKEKKVCIPLKGETEESCKAKKQEFDKEKKSCIETEASCKDKKKDFDKEKKVCIETEDSCKELSPVQGFDKDKKVCIPLKEETEESCKAKKQGFDKEKKACVEIKKLEGRDKCEDDNRKWKESQQNKDKEDGSFIPNRYVWLDNKCVDKQAKKKDDSDDDAPDDTMLTPQYPQKAAPGRFQPVSIPTRQVYILPGMP